MNCGFVSFAQCMATVSGIGGFCVQNNTYQPPARRAQKENFLAWRMGGLRPLRNLTAKGRTAITFARQ